MGKHNEWRKVVKRERRRKIRTQKAKERDRLSNFNYTDFLKEQEEIEQFEIEQIEIQNKIENEKWITAEEEAIEQWKALQLKNEQLLQKKLQQKAKLRLEWEKEKDKKKKAEEALKEIELRNKKRQESFMNNLEKFLNGDSVEPPKELLILYESKPGQVTCPFFTKTACCRFGDECSRNHIYPGITKILLAANMFGHFGLENTNVNEYDTDIMLEYDDSDTYKHFQNFFHDILPEFQKFGQVVQLKVCKNYEKHLCGNTYIEYANVRSAVSAYRALHARWYGGKQLSLQFCQLKSWKSAICGLQTNRRCPKGRSCNYLHVFKNPLKLQLDMQIYDRSDQSSRTWRWSESPEPEVSRKAKKTDKDKHRDIDKHRSRNRGKDDNNRRHKKRHKHRSRS